MAGPMPAFRGDDEQSDEAGSPEPTLTSILGYAEDDLIPALLKTIEELTNKLGPILRPEDQEKPSSVSPTPKNPSHSSYAERLEDLNRGIYLATNRVADLRRRVQL